MDLGIVIPLYAASGLGLHLESDWQGSGCRKVGGGAVIRVRDRIW